MLTELALRKLLESHGLKIWTAWLMQFNGGTKALGIPMAKRCCTSLFATKASDNGWTISTGKFSLTVFV